MVRWVLFTLAFAACRPLAGQNTFQKKVEGVNGLFTIEQTVDNHFWLGTFLGKILRLDGNGQWLGGENLHKGDTTETRFIYDLERTPDNGVWALYDRNNANTALDDYLILGRLDASGQPLWQTSVHYGEVLHWAHTAWPPIRRAMPTSFPRVSVRRGAASPTAPFLPKSRPMAPCNG